MRAVLLPLLLLAACAPVAPPAPPPADAAAGQRLAEQRCASCHAVGPTGASPRRNAPPFRDLHRRYPVDQLAESLAEGIVTGHPDMPAFTFDRQEIEDFLAYLRSLER
jgi:mono/diheme cytochrome c family protein